MAEMFRVQVQMSVWVETTVSADSLDEALVKGQAEILDGGGDWDFIRPIPTGTFWVLDTQNREVLSNV